MTKLPRESSNAKKGGRKRKVQSIAKVDKLYFVMDILLEHLRIIREIIRVVTMSQHQLDDTYSVT